MIKEYIIPLFIYDEDEDVPTISKIYESVKIEFKRILDIYGFYDTLDYLIRKDIYEKHIYEMIDEIIDLLKKINNFYDESPDYICVY